MPSHPPPTHPPAHRSRSERRRRSSSAPRSLVSSCPPPSRRCRKPTRARWLGNRFEGSLPGIVLQPAAGGPRVCKCQLRIRTTHPLAQLLLDLVALQNGAVYVLAHCCWQRDGVWAPCLVLGAGSPFNCHTKLPLPSANAAFDPHKLTRLCATKSNAVVLMAQAGAVQTEVQLRGCPIELPTPARPGHLGGEGWREHYY